MSDYLHEFESWFVKKTRRDVVNDLDIDVCCKRKLLMDLKYFHMCFPMSQERETEDGGSVNGENCTVLYVSTNKNEPEAFWIDMSYEKFKKVVAEYFRKEIVNVLT